QVEAGDGVLDQLREVVVDVDGVIEGLQGLAGRAELVGERPVGAGGGAARRRGGRRGAGVIPAGGVGPGGARRGPPPRGRGGRRGRRRTRRRRRSGLAWLVRERV